MFVTSYSLDICVLCVSNRMYTYSHIYLCVQLHLPYIHLIPYTSHTNAYTNTHANTCYTCTSSGLQDLALTS